MKAPRICYGLIVTIALCSSVNCSAQAAPRYQVYFVAVGSGWYATPSERDLHGFDRIRGANRSAQNVAGGLASGGASYGILLTADDQNFVTVTDIEKAVRAVASRISAEKPANPLFVFYIASHGLSEGIAWSHFSIPGDFVYRGDPNHLDIEELSNSTLYAGSLVDQLEKLKIPFLVMLDSCRDGEEKHFSPSVLSPEATRNLNDVGAVLRVMNEFRDTYPVLFSAPPGESVQTVDDPLAPGGPQTIGPLARRFSLATFGYLNSGTALSLATFLKEMTSANLDKATAPAVTHAGTPNGANALFLLKTSAPRPFTVVQGTGAQMRVCCPPAPAATPAPKASRAKGIMSFGGPAGEYISAGKRVALSAPGDKISITQQGPGDLQVAFVRGEAEYDANFSTGSDARFEARVYSHAQRYAMGDSGTPGLEISGNGRACNEISGSFQVSKVEFRSDGTVVRFVAVFEQLCDDAKAAASGSIDVSSQ
jgi:hypothetical protein